MTPEEVMHEVRRIEISTRHLVRDIVAGEYSSAFRGRGVEFSEVREYQPGDDVRTIDWNVTARLGATYVKRYLEERELTVLFVVDVSASGRFGTRVRTKQALATEVCAVLALAAARNHDRVGAVWVSDRVEHFVPPRRGRRHVLRIINDLLSVEPAGTGTDLGAGLQFAESILRRQSVVFVASDFLGRGYFPAFESLGRRHDVVALQLYDPRERELPNLGLISVADPESGSWRTVDSGDPETRRQFRLRAEDFDCTLQRDVAQRGGDLIRLETSRSYAEPLIAFFRRRELGKRLGRSVSRLTRAVPVLLGLAALPLIGRTAAAQMSGQAFEVTPPAQPGLVGDSITIGFRIRLDERDLLFDTIPEPVGALPEGVRILSVEKLQRTPDRIFHGHAKLVFYRTGRRPVPLFALPFMRAVKGVGRATLPSDSAYVEIRPLLPAGNPALKDIRDLARAPRPSLLPWVLGVIAALLLLFLRRRQFRRRKSNVTASSLDPAVAEPTPDFTPYALALAELARIEREQWPRRNQVARHYEAVVDVLRDYLESAESIPARERTTAELLWSLPPGLSNKGARDQFGELLEEADLVKFARLEPNEAAAQRFLARSRTLLDQWRGAEAVLEASGALR